MLKIRTKHLLFAALTSVGLCCAVAASEGEHPEKIDYPEYAPAPARQQAQDAERKSAGCESCHTDSDAKSMHVNPAVVLGCVDCHGGDAAVFAPTGPRVEPEFAAFRDAAHVRPRYPETWHYPSSAFA